MDTFILARGEGPPLGNEIAPRLEPRGDQKGLSRLAFKRNHTTLPSWAAYAALRRLRRKRSGSVWSEEIFA